MPPGEATYIWDVAGTKKFWAKGEYCVHWIIVYGKPTMYTFECLQDLLQILSQKVVAPYLGELPRFGRPIFRNDYEATLLSTAIYISYVMINLFLVPTIEDVVSLAEPVLID
ncbi:hypothetical protein EDD18DRAFT_1355225 [Armillaria luteobubalina]|uniref:Uncharacterized protein n=1 Tax=Armillaria luteobubalina TaxID=153913 RepID=A0AA39Q445_9AGAR|nr:hypothetical protein EDD18DRAFT_1355225 [Armillaria luteobubalina]